MVTRSDIPRPALFKRVRSQTANSGTDAAKGIQYFWLSKDCYDFFPPLTMINERGYNGRIRPNSQRTALRAALGLPPQ
jgi:hypothetical protein